MTTDDLTNVEQESADSAAPPRRFRLRRLFRFSLRTMLIATAVLGVWLAVAQHRTHRQRDAVAAIREYGGWVRYDYQFPSGRFEQKDFDPKAETAWPPWAINRIGIDFFHDVVQVDLKFTDGASEGHVNYNLSDEALKYLPALADLRVLRLSNTQATDESMRHMASLAKLEQLYMWGVTEVSDVGAANLENLPNLRYVRLSHSKITDETLMLLSDLPKIECLYLGFNRFTDEGVAYASRNHRITNLSVGGGPGGRSPITDASLEYLGRMPNLREIDLCKTWVTAAGRAQFSKNHPNCQVVEPVHVVD